MFHLSLNSSWNTGFITSTLQLVSVGQTLRSLLKVTQGLRVEPEIGPKSVYFQSLDFLLGLSE